MEKLIFLTELVGPTPETAGATPAAEAVVQEKDIADTFADIAKTVFTPKLLVSIGVAAVMIVIWQVYKRYRNRYRREHPEKRDSNVFFSGVMYSVIRIVILLLAVMTILQIYGINITSLVAGLGIVSAIVGLALQDYLKDLIMGIHIRTDSFFREGDVVSYEGIVGEIVSFTMKTTKIRDLNTNDIVSVCNRDITKITKIAGWFDIDLQLPYEEDHKRVHGLLANIALKVKEIPGVKTCAFLGTEEFGASAICYKLRVEATPTTRASAKRQALYLIQGELKEAGIEIPYTQIDVHHR
ncbi:MAG: mechanosensitive ion channel family protein [Lachnospiraceae bacterium]|nr:mechanosensitive ion channel family protein [Lachnospiraceae bacterium]